MLKKRIVSGTAAVVLTLGCAAAPIFDGLRLGIIATAEKAENKCGESLTWAVDGNGVLTVSGTGDMNDYSESDAPWKSTNILKAFIKKGATSVSSKAFAGSSSLVSTFTAGSVASVGSHAYENCSELRVADLADGVKSVGDYAFCTCTKLGGVRIPASVTSIGTKAFGYSGLNGSDKNADFKIYCYAGTAGETYAKDNGFDYELLKNSYTKQDVVAVCKEVGGSNLVIEPVNKFLTENQDYLNSDDYAALIVGLKEMGRRYVAPVAESLFRKNPDQLNEMECMIILMTISKSDNADEIMAFIQLFTETRGIDFAIVKNEEEQSEVVYKVTDEKKAEASVTFTVAPMYDSANEAAPDLTKLTVTACDAEGNAVKTYNADASGNINLSGIGDEEYDLKIELEGFATRSIKYKKGDILNDIKLCKFGDVDGNGIVDQADIGMMQQVDADWNVEFVYNEAADVNVDGKYSSEDLSRLQQYLAEWNVKLGTP